MSLAVPKFDYSSHDWRIPFDRTHLDTALYEQKLSMCKAYADGEGSIGPLLHDVTTYSYALFRHNSAPLELYAYQDVILNDPHRFVYFRASNQIGKSMALDIKAARNLLIDHGHGHNEAIISKSLPQSIYQMRRIKALLRAMDSITWDNVKGESDSLSVISVDHFDPVKKNPDGTPKVKYTNYLICAPCTEGALGYDLHEVNLDEFEFWDVDCQHFYNQIAEPRTYHTKGNITIFSNPNGMDHYGAELEKVRLPNGQPKFHTYVFNFLDKPGNTDDDLEIAKAGKTRQQVESTLLAIRSLSDRNYFTDDEITRSYDPHLREVDMMNKTTFWFLDVGAKHDQSVLVGGFVDYPDGDTSKLAHVYVAVIKVYPVGYPLSRVVGSYSAEQDSDGWEYHKSVKEYLEEHKVANMYPLFGVDVTGNSGITPLFESAGISPVDVTFSGPQKSAMYQRFKYFMEKGMLHRIKEGHWEYQARHLELVKTSRGHLQRKTVTYDKIHHARESDLDDCMDATAGFINLCDPLEHVPATLKRF